MPYVNVVIDLDENGEPVIERVRVPRRSEKRVFPVTGRGYVVFTSLDDGELVALASIKRRDMARILALAFRQLGQRVRVCSSDKWGRIKSGNPDRVAGTSGQCPAEAEPQPHQ